MIATIPNLATLVTVQTIAAAHWLPSAIHMKDRFLHGHNFRFTVAVGGEIIPGHDWVTPHDLRVATESAIGGWDHALLTPWTEEELWPLYGEHHAAWTLLGAFDRGYNLVALGAEASVINLARLAAQSLATIPLINDRCLMVEVVCAEDETSMARIQLVRVGQDWVQN